MKTNFPFCAKGFYILMIGVCLFSCSEKPKQAIAIYQPSDLVETMEWDSLHLQHKATLTLQDSFYLLVNKSVLKRSDEDSLILEALLPQVKDSLLLGSYYYGNSLRYSTSGDKLKIPLLRKAIKFTQNLERNNPISYLPHYDYARNIYSNYGDNDSCIYHAKQAEFKIPEDSTMFIKQVYNMIAVCSRDILNYKESENYTLKLIELTKMDTSESIAEYADAIHSLGTIYYDMLELSLAEIEYKKSISLLEKGTTIEKENNLFRYVENLILILNNQWKSKEAEKYLSYLKVLISNENQAYSYHKQKGLKLYKEDKFQESITEYLQSLEYFLKSTNINDPKMLELGTLLLSSTNSLKDFKQGRQIIKLVESNLELANIQDKLFQGTEYFDWVLAKLGLNVDEGIGLKNNQLVKNCLQECSSLKIEMQKGFSNFGEDNLNFITELFFEFYEIELRALEYLHRSTGEIGYAKQALVDLELQNQRSLFIDRIERNAQAKNINFIDLIKRSAKVINNKTQHQLVLDSLQLFYPEYYDIYFGSDDKFIGNLQEYCKTKSLTILEYFTGYEYSFGFVLSADTLVFKKIDNQIFNLLDTYLDSVSLTNLDRFNEINNSIASYLIDPFVENLGSDNILVVPGGQIGNVMFESLTLENGSKYLIEDYNVSYTFSAKNILISRELEENINPEILVFSYSDSKTIKAANGFYKELLGGYSEAKFVEKLYAPDSNLFAGETANKKTFIKEIKSANQAHIALHGSGDEVYLNQNKIFFRGDSVSNFLMPSDLVEFNLNIDLLFLSVCETNRSKRFVLNGSNSFVRAFAGAGVGQIISSSIEIPDIVSEKITKAFYQNYMSTDNAEFSISESKRQYLKMSEKEGHPIEWASLSLFKFN